MKNTYTHVSIVLDRSGSMRTIASDIIGGFNHLINDQKTVPGECTVTLVQFDDVIETVFHAHSVHDVPELTNKNYFPRNYTALYDAVGRAINDTGKFLKNMPEHDRPAKVVFVIITDGYENSSREFNCLRVQEMIKHQREAYKWDFVFIGADIDSYAVGRDMGIGAGSTVNMAKSGQGVNLAYASVTSNLKYARSAAAGGQSISMDFTAAQKKAQEDAGAKQ